MARRTADPAAEPDDEGDGADDLPTPAARPRSREHVPYEDVARATASRRKAREDLRVAQERIEELEDKLVESNRLVKAAGQTQQLLDQYKERETAWAIEKAMIAAGITDPEGIDLATGAYLRIPLDQRPKDGIGGWLGDREKLPRGVQAYMPEVVADDAGEVAATPAKGGRPAVGAKPAAGATPVVATPARRAALPNGDKGVTSGRSTTAPPFSGGDLSHMSNDDYKNHREGVWASLGRSPPARPRGTGGEKDATPEK